MPLASHLCGVFQQADVDRLTDMTVPVTAAIRRRLAPTFSAPPEVAPPLTGPVVMVLGPDLEIHAQTPQTDRYLRLLVPPDEGRSAIPAGAYNVAAQLLALQAGVNNRQA